MVKGKVCCIISTYNTKKEYLEFAVQSVLDQTYKNFELIIIDDGSEIPVKEVLKDFTDERISIYRNETNKGQCYSRNFGMEIMDGEYMAVLDGDDAFHKDKLKEQVAYLEKHPNCDILATQFKYLSDNKKVTPFVRMTKNPEEYRVKLFWDDEKVLHSSVMVRSEFIKKNNVQYDVRYKYATDYGFWCQCSKHKGRFSILNKYLAYYRMNSNQVSREHANEQKQCGFNIYLNQLENLNITPTETEKEIHLSLFHYLIEGKSSQETYDWYLKLLKASQKSDFYNKFYFKRELNFVLFRFCNKEYMRKHNKDYKKLFFKFLSLYNIYRAVSIRSRIRPDCWNLEM